MCFLGVFVCGVSVGFYKRAVFGVDPFQSFMAGLDALVPLDFGLLYIIANLVLLLFSLFADRHYIGLGTILNLFFSGYVADYSHRIILHVLPDLGLPGRILSLIIGVLIMCLACAFYFVADMGVSTYDAVALIITDTWKIGKFRYVRIITDFICVATGVLLFFIAGGTIDNIGRVVGVGTIIAAFFMGPIIDFFKCRLAEPFLHRKAD